MAVVSKEKLTKLYLVEGLSDREIATMYEVDRTSIVHLRKKYQIKTRKQFLFNTADVVAKKLNSMGYKAAKVKGLNNIKNYSLLVNEAVKIEVFGSQKKSKDDNLFRFPLTYSPRTNLAVSESIVKLPNGRFKRKHRITCDYIILCGYDGGVYHYWIIPSNLLPDNIQTITVNPEPSKSKYAKFKDAWDLLEKEQILIN